MTLGIEAEGISKAFGPKRVLEGLDLTVEPGEVLALVGPSGVGKTTLLRIVAGLDRPDRGAVRIGGLDAHAPGDGLSDVALVLQRPAAFRRSVFENVAYGLRLRDVPDEDIERRVTEELARVGMEAERDARAWKLSAGEAQRMCFARAAILRPRVLLLDEITANLDPGNVALLETAIHRLHEETRATVLVVTHNLFQAKRVARRAALLLAGRIVEVADVERFFADPDDARTRAFVRGEMPY